MLLQFIWFLLNLWHRNQDICWYDYIYSVAGISSIGIAIIGPTGSTIGRRTHGAGGHGTSGVTGTCWGNSLGAHKRTNSCGHCTHGGGGGGHLGITVVGTGGGRYQPTGQGAGKYNAQGGLMGTGWIVSAGGATAMVFGRATAYWKETINSVVNK